MTRETKVGIVVAASFVSLVGGVLFVKYTQQPPATPISEKSAPAVSSTPTADRNTKPTPVQRQAEPVANNNNNGGLPPLPGSLNEPFPALPPLPAAPTNTLPAPAPVPSQFPIPGDDEQQVVRSSSSSNSNAKLSSLPNQLPEMRPLPGVIPARADEPAPMPMSLPPIELPGTEPPKPKSGSEPKPMAPPPTLIDLPGTDKKDAPKPPSPEKNDNGLTLVPPPMPVGIDPAPMPKMDPKDNGMQLAPLPGAPMVIPGNNSAPPIDIKPMEVPVQPKPIEIPKPIEVPKNDIPMPNKDPKIPLPSETPKIPDPTLPSPKPADSNPSVAPAPKPIDSAPSITPVPTQIEPAPSITPSPNHLNDLPPLPPMPLPKNPTTPPAMTAVNVNNLPQGTSPPNSSTIQPPNLDRVTQPNANQPNTAPARPTPQPQIDSYDEEWYTAQTSDTFTTLSQKFYSDAKYAQALQQYNFDRTGLDAIRSGSTVRVPPVRVLERKHPAAIPGFTQTTAVAANPANSKPVNRPAAMGLPQSVGDPATFPSPRPDMGSEYTVRNAPKTLRDIAKETMGTSDKWNLIFRLNRWVNPDEPIPVDTKLRMPSDAVFNP
jgi:hypothetical protein